MSLLHPYFPLNTTITNFQPNNIDDLQIVLYLFGGLAVILVFLARVSLQNYHHATAFQKLIVCWLLLCGCIHTFLEGHFSIFSADIASRMDFLSQVCKQYYYYYLLLLSFIIIIIIIIKGVTKTPAISPSSKTPAQPCLCYENTCYRKFTKTPAV